MKWINARGRGKARVNPMGRGREEEELKSVFNLWEGEEDKEEEDKCVNEDKEEEEWVNRMGGGRG